jgi:DNA-binding response OmpR family regulator
MQTSAKKKQTALYVYDFVSVLYVPRLLSHFGWTCIIVVYQENFLEIAAEQQPDMIILDQLSVSEFGFCRQLKNNEKTKNIRLIVITAFDENISMAIEAGADACLSKPISRTELQKIIQPEIYS